MQRRREQFVVVGGGVVGAAVAYHLAKRGLSCLVLEQYEPGHARGSSHGAARITRHSYADLDYARLMLPAFRSWRALESDVGRSLYIRTGGISFCPAGVDYVQRVSENLTAIDVPHARVSGAAWNARHRLFSLPADYDVVFEPDAGMILASIAHQSMLEYAYENGCRLMARTAVLRIESHGVRSTLVCDCEGEELVIEADQAIIAAGGWVGRLVPALRGTLQPTLQHVFYLDPLPDGGSGIGALPAFIYKGAADDEAYYGMPVFGTSGVKVARHGGPVLDIQGDRPLDSNDRDHVFRFLRGHISGIADRSVIAEEACVYTVERGERFVVGPVAPGSNVWIASSCSGHGFKFSCFVGKVVSEMLLDGASPPQGWVEPSTLISPAC